MGEIVALNNRFNLVRIIGVFQYLSYKGFVTHFSSLAVFVHGIP